MIFLIVFNKWGTMDYSLQYRDIFSEPGFGTGFYGSRDPGAGTGLREI
jgi:hypothetical protein